MRKKILILLSLTSLLLPYTTLAAVCSLPPEQTAQKWFECIVNNVINIVVWPVFVAAVVVMFIWAGFLFLTAQGDPGKFNAAVKAFVWATIGAAIGIIAFSAVVTIKWILGLGV